MEFHFTIRISEELDTKLGSLRYVKIEVSLQIFMYIIYRTNDLGDEIIKRFTHSEIVNYLMEFHFTICIYIWELDTKFRSLRYVKIEVSLQIFLYIIYMDQWLIKRNY